MIWGCWESFQIMALIQSDSAVILSGIMLGDLRDSLEMSQWARTDCKWFIYLFRFGFHDTFLWHKHFADFSPPPPPMCYVYGKPERRISSNNRTQTNNKKLIPSNPLKFKPESGTALLPYTTLDIQGICFGDDLKINY